MLITTLTQCEGNYAKIKNPKELIHTTIYIKDYLFHFYKNKNYIVTLCLNPKGSGLQAVDLSEEISNHFVTLNEAILKSKK